MSSRLGNAATVTCHCAASSCARNFRVQIISCQTLFLMHLLMAQRLTTQICRELVLRPAISRCRCSIPNGLTQVLHKGVQAASYRRGPALLSLNGGAGRLPSTPKYEVQRKPLPSAGIASAALLKGCRPASHIVISTTLYVICVSAAVGFNGRPGAKEPKHERRSAAQSHRSLPQHVLRSHTLPDQRKVDSLLFLDTESRQKKPRLAIFLKVPQARSSVIGALSCLPRTSILQISFLAAERSPVQQKPATTILNCRFPDRQEVFAYRVMCTPRGLVRAATAPRNHHALLSNSWEIDRTRKKVLPGLPRCPKGHTGACRAICQLYSRRRSKWRKREFSPTSSCPRIN